MSLRSYKNSQATDEAITQAVSREIRMHEAISAHLIDVSTHDGVVTLSGAVSICQPKIWPLPWL
jgi:osmotically-inducible protein OsmY